MLSEQIFNLFWNDYFVFYILAKNRIIPSGANVFVPIYTMNRNEKVFENPESFKPERFLAENSMENQNSFNYIPFSAGPRNCIGQKFALYEIKSIVSKIINNFEISLTKESEHPPVLAAALNLKPENSIRFIFKQRVDWIWQFYVQPRYVDW